MYGRNCICVECGRGNMLNHFISVSSTDNQSRGKHHFLTLWGTHSAVSPCLITSFPLLTPIAWSLYPGWTHHYYGHFPLSPPHTFHCYRQHFAFELTVCIPHIKWTDSEYGWCWGSEIQRSHMSSLWNWQVGLDAGEKSKEALNNTLSPPGIGASRAHGTYPGCSAANRLGIRNWVGGGTMHMWRDMQELR